jgi:hypothetical protein
VERPVFRLEPAMPAAAYKTYRIVAPVATHFRPATCAEVNCPAYVKGWKVHVEELPPHLLHAAKTSGRRYREMHVAEGETYLVFEPGQSCFRSGEHRTRIDRPELFVVQGGDHRGTPRGTEARRHARAADWVDDFAEHQSRLSDEQQKG